MKTLLMLPLLLFGACAVMAQSEAKIREYKKVFRTYPFSDPDPVPEMSKIYPYFRYDGYTDKPVNKEWTVVELENDFIKVMVLPEVGGKIWAAIEKRTNKSFIYYNQVIKFRDVAMRGPWTSGGLEPNYGIVGHTPNCATPVDYTITKKADGSVSCVVGVLDLLTRSVWRVDVNLEKDKAYFTTNSTWYNASPFEQPYYHWMNGALRAADDLQFVFPGNKYIGHGGEYAPWPIDDKGRDLSHYKNNNFGSYKSYHVFGKHSNFWGAYYNNEDFGMARYSGYDDKAGKKIWIWGLSREGMIWEKLLTDDDGQYVEVQSGRLFNQPAGESSFTPFKNRGFTPGITDRWTEYWFPVSNTKGLVAASDYGSLNAVVTNGKLKIYFQAVRPVQEDLIVSMNGKEIYRKNMRLNTMQVHADSISFTGEQDGITVSIGSGRLSYDAAPKAGDLARPFASPRNFDWNSVQGLHLQGKEFIRQRMYTQAEEKLTAALSKDSNYLPALADNALLKYRQMKYLEALNVARRALAIDAYDPAANYYYGLVNEQLNQTTDAKDGYAIATQSGELRSAAFTRLALIHLKEDAFERAMEYALRAINANDAAIEARQLIALISRLRNDRSAAQRSIDTLLVIDPLNHFARFERWLIDSNDRNRNAFVSMIRNEMPNQTYLELATWYVNAGRAQEAVKALGFAKPGAEVEYWKAFLTKRIPDTSLLKPDLEFPFRHETAAALEQLIKSNDHWLLKYHLALIRWSSNAKKEAAELFEACGEKPANAIFYSARAKFYLEHDSTKALADLERAYSMDKMQWRYGRALINFHLAQKDYQRASEIAADEYRKHPGNYILGLLFARTLATAGNYAKADEVLSKLSVLPNEGATAGRVIYRDTKLALALQQMQKRNYRKALEYIGQSREWPEQLGSGKPYEQDIDERVQDWLAYKIYQAMKNNDAASAALKDILNYSDGKQVSSAPGPGDRISYLAYKAAGRDNDAGRFSSASYLIANDPVAEQMQAMHLLDEIKK